MAGHNRPQRVTHPPPVGPAPDPGRPGLGRADTPTATGVETGLLASERDDQVRRAFEDLPPRCQALLRVLMADPAPSYAEVSVILDMPVGSIGPKRSRCLHRLRSKSGIWDQPESSMANRRGET